jgi:hypothetical protein
VNGSDLRDAGAPALTVPLRSKRRERAQLAQKLQHAAPAAILLIAGVKTLGEGAQGFALALAIFEVVTSVTLGVSVLLAVRKAGRPAKASAPVHPRHGPDWIDVFIGVVLLVEALERYQHSHHLARPTIVMGVGLMVFGLLHGRIAARTGRGMTLRLEDNGLYVGGKPFRALRVKWADLASIDIGARYATVTARDGRQRRLDLADLEGADAVRAALEEAHRRLVELNSSPPESFNG